MRIENTLLIVPAGEAESGRFLKFEPLTLCPIDLRAVDFGLLTPAEVQWLNDYHAEVRRRLGPLVNDAYAHDWLMEHTAPVKPC